MWVLERDSRALYRRRSDVARGCASGGVARCSLCRVPAIQRSAPPEPIVHQIAIWIDAYGIGKPGTVDRHPPHGNVSNRTGSELHGLGSKIRTVPDARSEKA